MPSRKPIPGALGVGRGALVRNTSGVSRRSSTCSSCCRASSRCSRPRGDAANSYLPLNAGFAVATSTFENSHHLAPWTGFAVFARYAALAVVAAAFGLLRRDA
jgi:ABC-2 type transport system permease protein